MNSEALYQIGLDIDKLSNVLFQSIGITDDRKQLREWVQAEISYKLKPNISQIK